MNIFYTIHFNHLNFLQKENNKSDLNKSGNDETSGDASGKKTKSWKNVNKNDDENDDSWRINFLLKQRVSGL